VNAHSQYEDGEKEIRLLIESRPGDPELPAAATALENVTCRAAVVLLVSHFEGFLQRLAEEYVDGLGTGTLTSSSIPVGIREIHTVPLLAEIVATSDARHRESLLRKLPALTALWNLKAKPPAGTLESARLSREVTSASHEVIDKLFGLMGSNVAVCDGDIEIGGGDDGEPVPTNIRFALSDVVKCRNDVAHGDITRIPTRSDVERYLQFLGALVSRLSKKSDALLAAVLNTGD
jgi:hypothetical protein